MPDEIRIKQLELLSPAKNSDYGKIAINFGADAVYIGAPKFSARASAGNSLHDIEQLAKYAHKFHAKVYVALNTILYENELEETEKLINQIYQAGVDALIVQDLGILEMKLPPIALHASTQAHNTHALKVNFLEKVGFSRVVLARELSENQIIEIKKETTAELEVFVHGALCVSYSGQCYISHYLGRRSGNRGECAQACRLPFDLIDKTGKTMLKNKHLLSLKDMNRADYLYDLIQAGVTSFKIEGRMKDENYLKNNTAFYRKKLDSILENKPKYKTSSIGHFFFDFEPDTEKTFNRKYSDYFLNGRKQDIHSLDTPKSLGKSLGKITNITSEYFQLLTNEELSNGDGLCFLNENKELIGLRVEKVIDKKIYTNQLALLKKEFEIYRNHDHQFIKTLSSIENCRFVSIRLFLSEIQTGFRLKASVENQNYSVEQTLEIEKEIANNAEKAIENIRNQLTKTGGTIFKITDLKIEFSTAYFIQTSKLNELRRSVLAELYERLGANYTTEKIRHTPNSFPYFEKELNYQANISNSLSAKFYQRHGVEKVEKAFELSENNENKQLMVTKLCIKYNLGQCEKYQKPTKSEIPKYLKYNNQKFMLEFDCKNCVMLVKS